MTDTAENMDLFDDAKATFAAKEDLKDRLALVFATGKTGKRRNADGKDYDWVETVTLVLDDSPSGDFFTELVPSATDEPFEIAGLQWSTGGMVARLKPRAEAKNFRPILGRINEHPNKIKGRTSSWSIAEPSDEDRARARDPKVAAKTLEIYNRLSNPVVDDASAFE